MNLHITVAALVQRDGLYLMVEERQNGAVVFNQPAGHVEPGETIIDATARETLEESRWRVSPESLIGVYVLQTARGHIYYRFGLNAVPEGLEPGPLDDGIIAAHWLSLDEIARLKQQQRLRSPLVWQLIEDSRAGQAHSLDLIHEHFHA